MERGWVSQEPLEQVGGRIAYLCESTRWRMGWREVGLAKNAWLLEDTRLLTRRPR